MVVDKEGVVAGCLNGLDMIRILSLEFLKDFQDCGCGAFTACLHWGSELDQWL